jgi:adenylate cyclase
MPFSFADHVLDVERRELRRNGQPIALEPQVFDLLVYLISNRSRVVTKDEMLDAVWGGRIVSDSTLTSRINAARKAIGDSGDAQTLIRTSPRKGIRFIGAVSELGTAEPLQLPPIPPNRPSIAVLAFTNMSGDTEQEYFSDGISEDIITDLSRLSDVHVIARNSSFAYKKTAVPVPEVARTLGVRYVLEGSVRKAGNRVRVNAQLIDATTGGHVWANRYDRELTDIFAVQDELTQEIVSALKIKLTDGEQSRLTRKRAVDLKAYELYLRGHEQSLLHTATGNIAARNFLERALAIDPAYTAARARIVFLNVMDYVNGWSSDPERSLKQGLALAESLVAADPEDADSHYALSVSCTWNRELERAVAEADRCLALSPNLGSGYLGKSHAQTYLGDSAGALRTLDAYMLLDPLYPEIALYFQAEAHFSLGDYATAARALERRLERTPRSETSLVLLAACLGHLGRREDGLAAWQQAHVINPAYSIERRRTMLPFKDPAQFERRLDGLRKAGVTGPWV